MSKFKAGDVVVRSDDYSFGATDKLVVLYANGSDVKVWNEQTQEQEYPSSYDLEKTYDKPWKAVRAKVDGYEAVVIKKGSAKVFTMGCQAFTTVTGFRKHWAKDGGDHDRIDYMSDYDWKDRLKANKKRLAGMEKLYAKIKEI